VWLGAVPAEVAAAAAADANVVVAVPRPVGAGVKTRCGNADVDGAVVVVVEAGRRGTMWSCIGA